MKTRLGISYDSHEIPVLMFYAKQHKKKRSKCLLLQLWLALYAVRINTDKKLSVKSEKLKAILKAIALNIILHPKTRANVQFGFSLILPVNNSSCTNILIQFSNFIFKALKIIPMCYIREFFLCFLFFSPRIYITELPYILLNIGTNSADPDRMRHLIRVYTVCHSSSLGLSVKLMALNVRVEINMHLTLSNHANNVSLAEFWEF